MTKKRLILILILVFFSNFTYAENLYYERCPIVNKETNLKRFPFNNASYNMFKVSINSKISIKNKTLDTKGDIWYYGSLFDGENKYNHGWIKGEYINFLDGFDEDYWKNSSFKIDEISFKHLNIDLQIENLLTELFQIDWSFKKSSNILDENLPLNVSLDTLNEGVITESFESHIWYMKENNYVINLYQFDWGTLYAFVNNELKIWRLIELELTKRIDDCDIYVGMSLSELEEKLGSDYTLNDKELEFFNTFNGAFYISFIIEDNVITKIKLSLQYS